MDSEFEILESAMPQKTSNTEAWVSFWELMKAYYGTKRAQMIFSIAWKERGGTGSNADVVKLRTATGVSLDNQSVLDSAETLANSSLGVLESATGKFRIAMYIGGGVILFFVVGVIYRIITASASEIGEAAGTAVKVATRV